MGLGTISTGLTILLGVASAVPIDNNQIKHGPLYHIDSGEYQDHRNHDTDGQHQMSPRTTSEPTAINDPSIGFRLKSEKICSTPRVWPSNQPSIGFRLKSKKGSSTPRISPSKVRRSLKTETFSPSNGVHSAAENSDASHLLSQRLTSRDPEIFSGTVVDLDPRPQADESLVERELISEQHPWINNKPAGDELTQPNVRPSNGNEAILMARELDLTKNDLEGEDTYRDSLVVKHELKTEDKDQGLLPVKHELEEPIDGA